MFGNRPDFDDETAWNYEIGSKSRIFGGRGYVNASAFYIDINDLQAVVTAGQCSSRLVFSVPSARSIGGELEFGAVVSDHFDFSVSVGYNDAELTIDGDRPGRQRQPRHRVRDPGRAPACRAFPTGRRPSRPRSSSRSCSGITGYLTGTWQYIGSRYTQVGDDVPGFGVVPLQPPLRARWGTRSAAR